MSEPMRMSRTCTEKDHALCRVSWCGCQCHAEGTRTMSEIPKTTTHVTAKRIPPRIEAIYDDVFDRGSHRADEGEGVNVDEAEALLNEEALPKGGAGR